MFQLLLQHRLEMLRQPHRQHLALNPRILQRGLEEDLEVVQQQQLRLVAVMPTTTLVDLGVGVSVQVVTQLLLLLPLVLLNLQLHQRGLAGSALVTLTPTRSEEVLDSLARHRLLKVEQILAFLAGKVTQHRREPPWHLGRRLQLLHLVHLL